MSIDVNNPAHIEALRWACALDEPIDMNTVVTALQAYYVRAIHRPDVAASLVRGLLARAGVFLLPVDDGVEIQYPAARVDADEYSLDFIAWDLPDVSKWRIQRMLDHEHVPRLILALLDLAPGDREGALRALREAGR